MPLELNTMIVTKGKERRIEENLFILEKDGYRLYPIDIPIEVKRTIEGDTNIGVGKIKKLEWEKEKTVIYYELISLYSIN